MTAPGRCRGFGLEIATAIPIPGAIAADGALPPDIVVRQAAVGPARDEAGRELWRDKEVVCFAPPGVGLYRCTAAGRIEVAPCARAGCDDLAALLIATALPAVLWLRGCYMLHAAAAVLPGHARAVALVGDSGAGKSTLVADLVQRGARLVADDSLCLRPGTAAIRASGLPGGYFAHHRDPAARRFVTVDPRQALAEAPLGAILLLDRHPPGEPATFGRLPPLEALTAVLRHRHRPAVPALFGDAAALLRVATRIARTPVWRWSRPTGSPRLTAGEWQAISRLNGEGRDG